MKKRMLSILFAAFMLLTLLPTTALAGETPWNALNKALHVTSPESKTWFRVNSTSPLDITLLDDIKNGNTPLTIPEGKTVTLRLEGHTIDRSSATAVENGSAIQVQSGATLNVLGTGTITGGNTTGNGGGICNNGGTVKLIAVTVDGNKAVNGGGIYNNGGTADLGGSTFSNNTATGSGGAVYTTNYAKTDNATITGCNAAYGGAVYVAAGGRFQMVSGKIESCQAVVGDACGGGVYVENGGTATFGSSASVTGNTAVNGGGIYSKGAVGLETATISGSTVTGSGGGIYLGDGGSIFLGKNAKVTGNTKNGAANNLYLCDNILKVKFGTGEDVPAPTSSMSIGVTTATAPTAGSPVKLTENGEEAYKSYIVPDRSDCEVAFDTDHLVLQAKSTPPHHDTVVTTVTMPLIKKGNRGDNVTTLQASLNALGYNCGAVDGIFGKKTYAAVVAFQKAAGISVDGIVGPETWGKLGVVETASSAAVMPTVSSNMPLVVSGSTGDAVRALQKRLNALGYNCGAVDGIFGKKTLAAVKAYQTAKGLTVDGKVGSQTWSALG